MFSKKSIRFISLISAVAILGGCTGIEQTLVPDNSYSRTKKGALVGALTGAVVGAASSKNQLEGALVGAAAGAAVGGGVGYLLDKQANEVAQALGTRVNNDPLALVDPNQTLVVSRGDRYVKIMFRDKMMFAVNSDNLQASAKNKVNRLANLLIRYPKTIVQVAGFTDSTGTYAYNQALSEKRARTVARTLQDNGIDNPIMVKGCSYNKPLVPNKTATDRALNRRVEIYLYNSRNDIIDPCR